MRDLLIYIHVPKTGGMTVHETLQDGFGPAYLRTIFNRNRAGSDFLSEQEVQTMLVPMLDGIQAVSGHLLRPPLAIPGRRTLLATTLRDPFSWALSHYFHSQRRNWVRPGTSFAAYIKDHYPMGNYQTLHFAASGLAADAVAQLDRFLVVGITDMLDEFLQLLDFRLHQETGTSVRGARRRVNVATNRSLTSFDLSADELTLVMERLGEDLKLYHYARHRFLKDWQAFVGSTHNAAADEPVRYDRPSEQRRSVEPAMESLEVAPAAHSAAADEAAAARRRSRAIWKQRLRWTVPVTQPLLLCSQVQRSGGTLLARLFDGHPECFAHPHELKWGRPRKWHWPQLDLSLDADALLARLDEDWPATFARKGYSKYSQWTHRHNPEQARPYPFIFDVELQRKLFAAALAPAAERSQRRVLDAYLTSLFNAWLDYQNLYRQPKRWVTAFVPKLTMSPGAVERFFADYPDGLLVTIVRHPGSWLASVIPHLAAVEREARIDSWLDSTDASVRASEAFPGRVVVLLFEDLVRRTDAVMRMLSARMGIAFADTLLDPTYNSMPVLSDSSHAPTTGVDVEVTERYARVLTAEQLMLVEREAMPRFASVRERFSLPAT